MESQNGEPLRILVLSPWGLSGGYGGPIILLNRLFGSISNSSNAVIEVLYRQRDNDATPEWVNSAIPMVRTEGSDFGRAHQLMWIFKVWIFLMLRGQRYDVIHLQGAYFLNLLPVAFNRTFSRLVVLPVLEGGDLSQGRNRIVRSVKRFVLRRVANDIDLGMALSHGISDELTNLGVPPDNILFFPNIVSTSEFAPTSNRVPPSANGIHLGFVGKLGPVKRPHLLLEAIHVLKSRGHDNILATFIGPFVDVEYEEYFTSMVTALGLDADVRVTGFTSRVQVFLEPVQLFVLPSSAEGMPGAMAEAMACGIPCLVTDVGQMGSTVSSSGAGSVIDPDARSIARRVEATLVKGEWLSMSEAARSFAVSNCSQESVADKYLESVAGPAAPEGLSYRMRESE